MMNRLIYLLIALLCLSIQACTDEWGPRDDDITCSMYADGTALIRGDYTLIARDWPPSHLRNPYYLSDDHIFYSYSTIYRKSLGGLTYPVNPDSLDADLDVPLLFDTQRQKLYFASNGKIYGCTYTGHQLTLLSGGITEKLIPSSLSPDGNHLIAVQLGKIRRLNLETGIWTEPSSFNGVLRAYYDPSEDVYYYFGHTGNPELSGLWSWRDSEAPQLIYTPDAAIPLNDCQASADLRYFGLLYRRNFWTALLPEDKLVIFDREQNSFFSQGAVHSFAFSPTCDRMIYSAWVKDVADLRMRYLPSGETELLYDGIFSKSHFFRTVKSYYWRGDGQKLHFKAVYSTAYLYRSRYI